MPKYPKRSLNTLMIEQYNDNIINLHFMKQID